MRVPMRGLVLLSGLVAAVCLSPGLSANQEPVNGGALLGRWEKLPLPAKDRYVHCMTMEPGGIVWVMTDGGLYYWDGNRFHPPSSGQLTTSQYLTQLYGGAGRGAYATQRGEREHHGRLYRLSDGEARYLCDFYYEATYEYPGLYVSKSGKLYNWGNRFVAVRSGRKWKRIEAKLSVQNTIVLDTGDVVHFYYNQTLYSAGADDNFIERDVPGAVEVVPGQRRVHGALWAGDKMMILEYGGTDVYIYDLNTCQAVAADGINAAFGGRNIYDLFGESDGSAWVLGYDEEIANYIFYRISPQGEVIPVWETGELAWGNDRCWQFPHSVLNASDGSIWFGLKNGGVARYQDGRVRVFDWREGVNIGSAQYFFEDPHGRVYAASHETVYVCDPSEAAGPLPVDLTLWEDHSIACYHPILDCYGNVWMFLKDRPGEFSRWDGYDWHHVRVPFGTSKVSRAMADDRGHILVEMASYPEGCFDVGPDSVKRYENLESALVAAVADGAKRFDTGPEFQGCYVLEGGRIWYGYRNYPRFSYFDGERWDELGMSDDVDHMYESPKYGILVFTQGRKYYTYDRGQIVEVKYPDGDNSRFILGPKGFQPFEQELLQLYPRLYTPVERGSDGKYYLLSGPTKEDQSSELIYTRGDPLPRGTETVTPGYFGGYWTDYSSVGAPWRVFAGKAFSCDFTECPLNGKENDIRLVLEDRARNLWIDAGWYAGAGHVFLKRLGDFRLQIADVPTKVKRSFRMRAEPLLAGLDARDLRLFWRFDGGLWCGGGLGNSTTIRFPASGEYRVEIMGIDLQGGTSEVSTLVVNAAVPLPGTRLTDEGPYSVKDVVWLAPAEPVPSESGALPELAYRIDGRQWKLARDGKIIPMGGLDAGDHVVEIAAQEAEEYRDITPLRLHVTYEPDFNYIVESRLDIIVGEDSERAARALSEIKSAGPQVIPILRQKLSEARKAARLAAALGKLLSELDGEHSQ